jgi:SH3-like domain-containing protein
MTWGAVIVAAIGLQACGGHAEEGANCPAAQRAHTLSGYCVPRWVSLKHDEVLGRKGPGKDYDGLWEYRVRGLPVQVVAETEEWRRICDPNGGAAWVHESEIDGRRTVMSLAAAPAPMLRTPSETGRVIGLLRPKSLASLDKCKGNWCQVKAGGVRGWIATDQVWGVASEPQCR